MSSTVSVRRIGNSYGIILPKRQLEELGVEEGDKLFILQTPDGLRLTAYDPEFADVMDATRRYMREHRDALRELAK